MGRRPSRPPGGLCGLRPHRRLRRRACGPRLPPAQTPPAPPLPLHKPSPCAIISGRNEVFPCPWRSNANSASKCRPKPGCAAGKISPLPAWCSATSPPAPAGNAACARPPMPSLGRYAVPSPKKRRKPASSVPSWKRRSPQASTKRCWGRCSPVRRLFTRCVGRSPTRGTPSRSTATPFGKTKRYWRWSFPPPMSPSPSRRRSRCWPR